jgi:hypothetical protein
MPCRTTPFAGERSPVGSPHIFTKGCGRAVTGGFKACSLVLLAISELIICLSNSLPFFPLTVAHFAFLTCTDMKSSPTPLLPTFRQTLLHKVVQQHQIIDASAIKKWILMFIDHTLTGNDSSWLSSECNSVS